MRFVARSDSYTAEVQQVIDGNPEALFLVAGYSDEEQIMAEVVDSDYEGTILVYPELAGNELAEIAVGVPEGQVLTAWVTDDLNSPAYVTFAAAHIEHAGKLPQTGFYEANHYDQYIALALAMTAARSVDGPAVAAQVPRVLSPPGTKVYSYRHDRQDHRIGRTEKGQAVCVSSPVMPCARAGRHAAGAFDAGLGGPQGRRRGAVEFGADALPGRR